MSDRRYVWLKMLLSASMVASLVPAPALAEVIDESLPSEEVTAPEDVAAPEEVVEGAEEASEPVVLDDEGAVASEPQEEAVAPAPVLEEEDAVASEDDGAGELAEDKAAEPSEEPELTAASVDEPVPMELDTPISITIEDGSYWVGSFTVPEDGTYIFESSNNNCDPYGYLYEDEDLSEELSRDDDSAGSGDFRISYQLYEGMTVYLKAQTCSNESGSYDVCVTRLDVSDLSDPSLDFLLDKQDYAETGRPVALEFSLFDIGGNRLTEGIDFELVYSRLDNESGEYVELSGAPSSIGVYSVYARECAGSSYHGETSSTNFWIVSANNLSVGKLNLEKTTFELNGSGNPVDVAACVTVTDGLGNTLAEGVDYELVYSYWDDEAYETVTTLEAPSTAGEYEVCATAVEGGDYVGSTSSRSFSVIDPYDISGDGYRSYFWPSSELPVTGAPVKLPKVVIAREDEDGLATFLTEGTDYVFDHYADDYGNTLSEAPSEAGEYGAYYKGIGAYNGMTRCYFAIADYAHEGIDLSDSNVDIELEKTVYTATGSPIEPEARIVDWQDSGKYVLEEGKDYVVDSYLDSDYEELSGAPSEPGEYYVVFKGVGAYGGTVTRQFGIYAENDLRTGSIDIVSNDLEIKDGVMPKVDVRVHDSAGKLLKEGLDYELVYFIDYDEGGITEIDGAPTGSGEYRVAARAIEGSGYTGQTARPYFSIYNAGYEHSDPVEATAVNMVLDESYEASLSDDEYLLGTFVVPEDGIYEFASLGNDDTYGELYADADLTDLIAYDDDKADNGNFRIVVELDEGQTVYLLVRGYGWGAVDFEVQVTLADSMILSLSDATLELDKTTYEMSGEPVIIEATVTDQLGNTLIEGTDYDLVFYDVYIDEDEGEEWPGDELDEAPSEVGTYFVRAVGKGNYEDSTYYKRFEIVDPSDLSYASVIIDDYAEDEVALGNDAAAAVTVRDARKAILTAGTHYDLQFKVTKYGSYVLCDDVPSEVGTYYVRAVAKEGSGYTGATGWYYFDIIDPHDLSSRAEIQFKDYAYRKAYEDSGSYYVYRLTGSAVKPTVVVSTWDATGKYITLTEGTDYTVSYKNNTAATTHGKPASVTITGTGTTYTGSFTEYFEITNKLDLAQAISWYGAYLNYDGSRNWVYPRAFVGGAEVSYMSDSAGVKPAVSIAEGASGVTAPVAGTDFTVSYVDVDENEVTPTTAGSYAVLLTATGSQYEGTVLLPFDLVDTKSLKHYSLSLGMDYDGYAERENSRAFNVYGFAGSLSELANEVAMTLYDGTKALKANVDYLIETVVDDAAGFIKLIISGVTGGRYTDSVTGAVYIKKFDIERAYVSVGKAVYGAAMPSVSVSVYAPTVSGLVYGRVKKTLVRGTDYNVSYDTSKLNVGDEATLTITGIGGYTGTQTATYVIQKGASSISLAKQTATYTGNAIAYSGTVNKSGSTGAVSYAYYADKACTKPVAAGNVKGAGTYYVKATLAADANFEAATSAPATLTIARAANPYAAKAKASKQKVKLSKVKKKAQTLASNVKATKAAQGSVTYANGKGSAKTKKWKVNKRTGKVTVPKGTKRGTYTVKVKATAAGNANYAAKTVTIKYKVVVK